MADPICRWRNPYIDTVIELINILPSQELSKFEARKIISSRSPYNFFRTPYQLACQLGLYYETEDKFFPKFYHTPNKNEVSKYLKNWILHYSVPNPYTQRGFINVKPFSIHSEICKIIYESQNFPDWITIKDEIFREEIGNNDILINSINSYSPIIIIENNKVLLKKGMSIEDLPKYIDVDISGDRNDKEYFFDIFKRDFSNDKIPRKNTGNIVEEIPYEEIEEIFKIEQSKKLTQTEKNQIVSARIGQGIFRRKLINEIGTCFMTSVDDSKLLIASHIKPWRESNNFERLDVKNGFLLTPTYDKLFDRGLISFKNSKEIIISSQLSSSNKENLGLIDRKKYSELPIFGREKYLEHHRDVELKK
jgi:hypothetical protein